MIELPRQNTPHPSAVCMWRPRSALRGTRARHKTLYDEAAAEEARRLPLAHPALCRRRSRLRKPAEDPAMPRIPSTAGGATRRILECSTDWWGVGLCIAIVRRPTDGKAAPPGTTAMDGGKACAATTAATG